MGISSRFITQKIEVKDKEKLKSLEEREYGEAIRNAEYVDFELLDGCKIIGYWYDEFIKFLGELAKCIEGYVDFEQTENGYTKIRIFFEDGLVYISECEITKRWKKKVLLESWFDEKELKESQPRF
ncbi:MAG: hypothetical protein ACFFDH_00265 [Promethearchaeota archaeon]